MRAHGFAAILLTGGFVFATSACAVEDDLATITRVSQEFSDASAVGDAKAFEKYLDDDVIFMDESGAISTKHDIVAGATPPTEGISNKLVQSDLDIKLHSNVAVTSFTDNSTVNVYGQISKARYRSTEVWMKKNGAWKMISSQTLALPDDPAHIRLSADALDQYVGNYDAGPKLAIRIERKGDSLLSSTNGGKSNPLLVEARDVLFTPGQPRLRRIFERDATGKVIGFNSRREGHDLHFKRTA
jgi:ketosteroid isomerase-like protein